MQQTGGAGLSVQLERRKKWGCCCPGKRLFPDDW